MFLIIISNGTGLIGRIKTSNGTQYVLLTCNHVIPTKSDVENTFLYFGYTDVAKEPSACEAMELLDTQDPWFWSDPTYHDPVSGWGLFQHNNNQNNSV